MESPIPKARFHQNGPRKIGMEAAPWKSPSTSVASIGFDVPVCEPAKPDQSNT